MRICVWCIYVVVLNVRTFVGVFGDKEGGTMRGWCEVGGIGGKETQWREEGMCMFDGGTDSECRLSVGYVLVTYLPYSP